MHTLAKKPKATQQTTSQKSSKPGRAFWGQRRDVQSILHLQPTTGNQAVQRLLQANTEELESGTTITASTRFTHDFSRIPLYFKSRTWIQAKPAISTPRDIYEQEADRVANQVMRMPGPQSPRNCACGGGCPKCQTRKPGLDNVRLQSKNVQANEMGQIVAPPIVHEVLAGPGQPMDSAIRRFMEPRFGCNFDQVRVHVDVKAAESARAVNALAYTVGRNVVFGAGRYEPNTRTGRKLLAHELSHVLQQQSTTADTGNQVMQRAVECDELGNCQSVPDPEGAVSMLPPGDCTPGEHRSLQNEVDRACKGRSRRCRGTDNCATLRQKIEANAECIRARSVINAKCFRGGDVGHTEAVMAAVGALNNCWAFDNRLCQRQPPVFEPVPRRVQERRPVVDRSFMERMAEITGLTGAALVTYIIISEGSRVFPPRNLVPVP